MNRIIRVFPRRTRATPTDEGARVGVGPTLFDEADAIQVSVTFSSDMPAAERLAAEWRPVAPVTIGGPALGDRGGDFEPGRYLKPGYVITSRGCPGGCWFCDVWRREGAIRELPIRDGWKVQDNNLLACTAEHIRAVFAMLRRVKADGHRIEFTGGLEAARLEAWHVDELLGVRPKQMFFAYDGREDLPPLRRAGKMLRGAGWTLRSKTLRAYVLCGHPRDTLRAADRRMRQTLAAGFVPMAMLYHHLDHRGFHHSQTQSVEWRRFQRTWARPALIRVTES